MWERERETDPMQNHEQGVSPGPASLLCIPFDSMETVVPFHLPTGTNASLSTHQENSFLKKKRGLFTLRS